MAEERKFNVIVSVPMDHPTPFDDLVKQATSMGMTVDQKRSAPELKTFSGSVTDEVYERLRAVPGVRVSRERQMRMA
jgi:hypothetical protein